MSSGVAYFPRALLTEAPIRSLSDRGHRALTYVTVGPHTNMIGAYFLPDGYIADDNNWPLEIARETISELSSLRLVTRFGDGRHILLNRHFEWNTVQNLNVLKSALKQVRSLPIDPLVLCVIKDLEPYIERFAKDDENGKHEVRIAFDTLRKTVSERSRNILSLSDPQSSSSFSLSLTREEEDDWCKIWKTFVQWPNLAPTATEHLAKSSWIRLRPQLPSSEQLIACINRQRADLQSANRDRSRSAGDFLTPSPHTWLEKSRGWENYLRDLAFSGIRAARSAT